ncbi:energy transducer TonB [Aquitalea sp. FJL05]|uniref:energy transducer TonB n=1 Tax=Aquitalea sp. FJL05 TaxID=2153366 RepID=UPI000F590CCA|nr:energy transducer TonB [Aquitalea sp. FJL05]RQO70901.1 energy transducer TonB [Aquitalea sp. FJL05]
MPRLPHLSLSLSTALLLSLLLHAGLLGYGHAFWPAAPAAAPAQTGLQLQLQTMPARMPQTPHTVSPPTKHVQASTPPLLTTPPTPTPGPRLPADSKPQQAIASPAPATPASSPANDKLAASPPGKAVTMPATSGAENHPALYRTAYLHNPEPPYPERSRELGEQGRVVLRVLVTPEGRAGQIDIVDGSHSRRLDEAARAAVADWRFVPARQDGTAIASRILVPISFSLQSH